MLRCFTEPTILYHGTDAPSQFPQRRSDEEDVLRAKNIKILHRLRSSLASASGLSLSEDNLSPLYQVLICDTSVFPQLRQFWDSF